MEGKARGFWIHQGRGRHRQTYCQRRSVKGNSSEEPFDMSHVHTLHTSIPTPLSGKVQPTGKQGGERAQRNLIACESSH